MFIAHGAGYTSEQLHRRVTRQGTRLERGNAPGSSAPPSSKAFAVMSPGGQGERWPITQGRGSQGRGLPEAPKEEEGEGELEKMGGQGSTQAFVSKEQMFS